MEGYMPRLSGSDVQQHSGKSVILMGKVLSDDGSNAQVQAADGTTINIVRAQGGGGSYDSPYVEIVGRATGASEVQEFKNTPWNEVDMDQYLKLTQFQNNQFKGMFHPSE